MHSLSVIPVVLLIESKKHDNLPHCFLSSLYCYSLLLANSVLSDKKHCFKRKERLFCAFCLLKAQNTCHLWTSEKTFYIDKQMRQTFFFPDYGSAGITAIHGRLPSIYCKDLLFSSSPPIFMSDLPALILAQLIYYTRHCRSFFSS